MEEEIREQGDEIEEETEYYYGSEENSDIEMDGGEPTRDPSEVCSDIVKMYNDMSGFETEGDSDNKKYKKDGENYITRDVFNKIYNNTNIRDVYKKCNTIDTFGSGSKITNNKVEDITKTYIDDIVSRINSYHDTKQDIGHESNLITSPVFIAKIYVTIMLLKLLNKEIYDYKKQWNKPINSNITELLGKMTYTNINDVISNIFQVNKGINEGKGTTSHIIPGIDSHKDYVNKKVFEFIDNYLKNKKSFDIDDRLIERIKDNFKDNISLSKLSINKQIIDKIEEARINANKEYNKLFLETINELLTQFIKVYPENHNEFLLLKTEINQSLPTLIRGQFSKNANDRSKMDFKYVEEVTYDINKYSGQLNIGSEIFETVVENAWYGIEISTLQSENPNIYKYIQN